MQRISWYFPKADLHFVLIWDIISIWWWFGRGSRSNLSHCCHCWQNALLWGSSISGWHWIVEFLFTIGRGWSSCHSRVQCGKRGLGWCPIRASHWFCGCVFLGRGRSSWFGSVWGRLGRSWVREGVLDVAGAGFEGCVVGVVGCGCGEVAFFHVIEYQLINLY